MIRATEMLKMAHLKNKSAKEVELKTIELFRAMDLFYTHDNI